MLAPVSTLPSQLTQDAYRYLMCFAVPAPNGRTGKSFEAYICTELFYHREVSPPSAEGDGEVSVAAKSTSLENVALRWKSKSISVGHHLEDGADGVWNETWEWEYERDELAFIRYVSHLSRSRNNFLFLIVRARRSIGS